MTRLVIFLIALSLVSGPGFAAEANKKKTTTKSTAATTRKKVVARKSAPKKTATRKKAPPRRRTASRSPWKTPTYADSTEGDHVDGEDLVVRRAAVEALGRYNGSVVVVDADTGRVLSIVNQKLAFQSGYQPCSTIKLVTALAALSEGIIEPTTPFRLSRRQTLNLKSALAISNNGYFASLGNKLGFARVSEYARMFGLGEKAGWHIEGERAGTLPKVPPKSGGVGMMTSFGSDIALTPLQLASLVSAIANGGTLYYLQYPTSAQEVEEFTPRVKRHLEIGPWVDDVKTGMRAAVNSGTARRANYDPNEPLYGKTGTCTDYGAAAHMGWFGAFSDFGNKRLAVAVMLTGGKPVSGPVASGIAGKVFETLSSQGYFKESEPVQPIAAAAADPADAISAPADGQ